MREYTYADIPIGQKESFTKLITVDMEDGFRNITGDFNPLHRDDDYAQEVGKGRFQQHVTFGMLTASLYSTLAGMYLPGKYSLIHSIDGLSFMKPVFTGDELTVTGEVVDKVDKLSLLILKITVRNQNNKLVSKASMKVLVLK